MSLVSGQEDQGVQTRILSVDGQAVRTDSGQKSCTHVWLAPGTHTIAVSCIKTQSYGAMSADTLLLLKVKANCDYELQGRFDGKKRTVVIKEKAVR